MIPSVAVAVATYNRAARLRALLDALAAQTLPAETFEVVVVNDGSTDETAEILRYEQIRRRLELKVHHFESNMGWSHARDKGWRLAEADVIAFTDDDCVPEPTWLEAGLAACHANPGAIVQGRTVPPPVQLARLGRWERPFARVVSHDKPSPACPGGNVFYPRDLLLAVDGFDTENFNGVPGEDADLAWRAIGAGAGTAFAPDVVVYHDAKVLGPIGKLRHASQWDMRVYARHPGLRRAQFYRYGLFWKRTHYWFTRALVAAFLPRRLWPLGLWLAYPYLRSLYARGKVEGGGPLLTPYYVLYDLVEMITVLRSAVRYRTPMI